MMNKKNKNHIKVRIIETKMNNIPTLEVGWPIKIGEAMVLIKLIRYKT